ncbi:MAG: autoinducer binding domain-containing protein [Pseudomonadota bacterium]
MNKKHQRQVSSLLSRLRGASPSGFAIALHIRYAAPRYLLQSYAIEWIDLYARRGLLLHDPTVHWGFANVGTIRWSALQPLDTHDVMKLAAEYGKHFGACVALEEGGSRTIASFTHPDRELTDEEIAACETDVHELHRLTQNMQRFSPDFHKTLKKMSIYLTQN